MSVLLDALYIQGIEEQNKTSAHLVYECGIHHVITGTCFENMSGFFITYFGLHLVGLVLLSD